MDNSIEVEGKRLLLLNHVNEKISASEPNNLKLIRQEVNKLAGKFVKPFDDDEAFLLTCAVCDEDDYYYLLINFNKEIMWDSCVGSIKAVDESSLGVKYNILKYLIDHDPDWLIDKVQKVIDDSGAVLFTDLKVK